jgi:hypothetical protein
MASDVHAPMIPSLQALEKRPTALAWSLATPMPLWSMMPWLKQAFESPPSQAFLKSGTASAGLLATPVPLANIAPRASQLSLLPFSHCTEQSRTSPKRQA